MTRSMRRCLHVASLFWMLLGAAALAAQNRPDTASTLNERPSYILLTGIVGGERGMSRLATSLRGEGEHVVVIDPYKESLDSADVSFAALARRVDRMLDSARITRAHVIGHAHGSLGRPDVVVRLPPHPRVPRPH